MVSLNKTKFFDLIILALFCVLSFGIFIPFIGLYSDDWVFLSVFQKFGHQGLTQYYQTNRPVLGWLFQVTMPIFGKSIFAWHFFALLAVFLCSISVRKLILLLWPEERLLSVIGGILFIVYPGFTLLPLSITFGHTYLVYLFFLLSTIFLVQAFQNPRKKWVYTYLSLLFAAANLFMMEYFFCLTFVQPFILWFFFRDKKFPFFRNVWNTIKFYTPWILVILISIIWRVFIFKYQTYNYSLTNIAAIKNDFFSGLLTIFTSFLSDIFKTGFLVWFEPAKFIFENKSQITLMVFTVVFIISGTLISFLIFRTYLKDTDETNRPIKKQGIPISLILLSLAGWPFWAIGLKVSLNGFNSRFTLPFIIGSVFLIISFFSFLRKRWVVVAISSILVGIALGKQVITIDQFHKEYKSLTSYMNQLHARIPGLQPGAFIISNEMPFPHFSYATLSSIIDWFYSPNATSMELDHVFVYSKDPFEKLLSKEFTYNNVNFKFSGSIDKSISTVILFDKNPTQYQFISCLTTLDDNNISLYTKEIPPQSSELAQLSNNKNIDNEAEKATDYLFSYYFPTNNENIWCRDYQAISILQDEGKYKEITEKYNQTIKPTYYLENIPFINAFFQTSDWNGFTKLMTSTFNQKPEDGCLLLEKYLNKLPPMQEVSILIDLKEKFNCTR